MLVNPSAPTQHARTDTHSTRSHAHGACLSGRALRRQRRAAEAGGGCQGTERSLQGAFASSSCGCCCCCCCCCVVAVVVVVVVVVVVCWLLFVVCGLLCVVCCLLFVVVLVVLSNRMILPIRAFWRTPSFALGKHRHHYLSVFVLELPQQSGSDLAVLPFDSLAVRWCIERGGLENKKRIPLA